MKPLFDYQLDKNKVYKFNLNHWTFWFTYDSVFFEEFGESDYAYDNFHDLCIDLREDYKLNRELHKDKYSGEPICYYFARYYEWNEKEKCFEFTDYKLTFRKGRISGRLWQ